MVEKRCPKCNTIWSVLWEKERERCTRRWTVWQMARKELESALMWALDEKGKMHNDAKVVQRLNHIRPSGVSNQPHPVHTTPSGQ